MKIFNLDFDTLFLGIDTYKINIEKSDGSKIQEKIELFLNKILKFKNNSLMFVLDLPDFYNLGNNLDIEGFKYINKKVEYIKKISRDDLYEIKLDSNFEVVEYDEKEHILDIELFVDNLSKVSRYYRDEKISNKAKTIYNERINRNLIYRSYKLFVCIDKNTNKVIGINFIIKESDKNLNIDLIGVLPGYQGKGIGKNLIMQIFNYAKDNGFNSIRVVTQGENIGAVNLYEKSGFKLIGKSSIYHYHK